MSLIKKTIYWFILIITVISAIFIYICPPDFMVDNTMEISSLFSDCGFGVGVGGNANDCLSYHFSLSNQAIGNLPPVVAIYFLIFSFAYFILSQKFLFNDFIKHFRFLQLLWNYLSIIRAITELQLRKYLVFIGHSLAVV